MITPEPESVFEAAKHGTHNSHAAKGRAAQNIEDVLPAALDHVVREAKIAAENYRPPRQIVAGGCWTVPVCDRPKNWKSMNIPEPLLIR